MEIEVEADKVLKKEKSIAKLFSPRKKLVKKVEKLIPEKKIQTTISEKGKVRAPSKLRVVSKIAGKEKKTKRVALFVIPLLASISLAFGASTYYYYAKYIQLVKTPILLEKSDRQLVLDNVNNLAELPGEENPIVATVGDVKKLIGEVFSFDAVDDDRVVIFTDAKKAIIYRPSSGKIVEAAPFLGKEEKRLADVPVEVETDLPNEQVAVIETPVESGTEKVLAETSEQVQVQKEEKKARVAVYNGTKTKGLSAKLADQISVSNASVDIVSKTSAKGDYAKTIVIDLTGKNTDLIANIASLIGGDISTSFPQDELMPEADILVIGGEK